MVSSHTDALTHLIREFMAGLREHLATADSDPDLAVDQISAAIAGAAAALALAWPLARRNGVLGMLLALVSRYWARRALR